MAKKLTINAVAMGNLKHRKKQYIALVLGVVLAMIFSSGVPFFISCSNSSSEEIRIRRIGRQDKLLLDAQDIDMEALESEGILDGPAGYMHILSYDWTEDPEKGTTVGWLDERAEELYYPQILEGRMPEQAGEIAVERNALMRMGLDQTKIGDPITLQEVAANEGEYLTQQQERTYTLVGILDNRKSNLEQFGADGRRKAAQVPAAFLSQQEQVALGGKENLIALVLTTEWREADYVEFNNYLEYGDEIDTNGMRYSGSVHRSISNSTRLVTSLSVLLALLSCFGIANAFASNLKERKKQIGMLRAVGATRRQIIQVFGREAVLIALVCTPISVAVSYFGVKLFANVMGDSFVFRPSLSILLIGAVFGFVVVLLSALIPLLVVSRVSPMQAIRDTELMRKMKNKKIRSQSMFRMDRLLAKRKMMFLRSRQVAVSLILAMTTVILFGAVGQSIQWVENFNNIQSRADYEVAINGWISEGTEFENCLELNDPMTEAQRQEALLLPEVERVSGVKRATVNLLISGEYPEYLTLNQYAGWDGSSRFRDAIWQENHRVELTPDNLHQVMQAEPNSDYEEVRQWGGYQEELFASPISGKSEDLIQKMQSSVIEGAIDLEKLNTGEEVILNAPPKIGYYYKVLSNGYFEGLLDLSEEHIKEMDPIQKDHIKDVLAEAECPYHVGDTLTLSLLVRGADGQPIRQDRTVRVGAIVSNGLDVDRLEYDESAFRIYTTVAGLDQFNPSIGYNKLYLDVSGEVTDALDMQMQNTLESVFPGKRVDSHYASNEQRIATFQTETLTACALILVLCMVSISLVNNSISAQIREGKRTIGTLRAVGASERDIIRSYVRQVLYMTGLGVLIGMVCYCVGSFAIFRIYGQTLGKFVLWPAPILFVLIFGICYCNLIVQVKKVSRQSIVENIREL